MEDEGILVPEEGRYFPYRATFDFESYFDKEKAQELKNSKKLTRKSAHVPLSVSVCSNVPGYQAPKCFASNGDPNAFITEFIQCLVPLAPKVHFCSANNMPKYLKLSTPQDGPESRESNDDRLAQILVDIQEGQQTEREQEEESEEGEESEDQSRDIDLMASDYEDDEEEIESENEQDRAFLNEIEEQEDVSFYRRLNVELDQGIRQQKRQRRQELVMYEEMLFGEAQTSDHKVLSQLEEKLIAYIQELPVLGFNFGKYDFNASKGFLFPYLIQHQPITFTVKRNSNHMCLKTDFLKLFDISNYLALGFSYDQFLKAYECEQTKGYFPYEWIDSLEKLQHPSRPPHEAFYSSLKNANISEDEYAYCQQVWEENPMSTVKDFLVWYNSLDVVPF